MMKTFLIVKMNLTYFLCHLPLQRTYYFKIFQSCDKRKTMTSSVSILNKWENKQMERMFSGFRLQIGLPTTQRTKAQGLPWQSSR